MMLYFETLLLAAIMFALLRCYLRRRWNVLKDWNIPHDPPSVWNFGHARPLFVAGSLTYELERRRKYGPVWGFYIVMRPRIVIHDPDMLRQIMVREFPTFRNRIDHKLRLRDPEMAAGLILAKGDRWKRSRVTIAPSFSPSKLRQMTAIVNWCVGNTLQVFKNKMERKNGCFFAKDVFSRLSLDVICSAALSTDTNSQNDTKEEPVICKHAKEFFRTSGFGTVQILMHALPFLRPVLSIFLDKTHVTYFKCLCQKFMEGRKEDCGTQSRVDLLQLMINAEVPEVELKPGPKRRMTPQEVLANAVTMLMAGYDTTGATMTFFAYNLAVHQDVQRHLREEIDRLFEKKGAVEYNDAIELKYLDMCVNESLRLYCPVTRTVRTAERDIVINGLTIPKGCEVTIPIYALCHDPEYWNDPMEYRPERMKDMSKIDPMLFQPFGSGPRNCIGSKFALMEIKMAFCNILRQFCFETTENTPKPPLEVRSQVTIRSKIDFELRVVPRVL